MHEYGQLAGDGNLCLFYAASLGEPKPPGFERRPFFYPRQQGAGGLKEIGADKAITAFGDSSVVIDLARLIAVWSKK
jgi:hypothetical protein